MGMEKTFSILHAVPGIVSRVSEIRRMLHYANARQDKALTSSEARRTIYEKDPVKVAKRWEKMGAEILHLVDLDGAKDGERANQVVVKESLQIETVFVTAIFNKLDCYTIFANCLNDDGKNLEKFIAITNSFKLKPKN